MKPTLAVMLALFAGALTTSASAQLQSALSGNPTAAAAALGPAVDVRFNQ